MLRCCETEKSAFSSLSRLMLDVCEESVVVEREREDECVIHATFRL